MTYITQGKGRTMAQSRFSKADSRRPAHHAPAMGLFVAAASAIALTLWAIPAWAQPAAGNASREYPIKAAYLYNFGAYVEWPADSFANAQDRFVIGVLGPAPFDSLLDEIAATKKIAGREIVIERWATAKQVSGCQMLFVSAGASEVERSEAVRILTGSAVLIVGETPGLANQGGVINFYIDDNKVRFEINPEAAQKKKLKISSKLLGLAKIVNPRQAASK